MSETTLVATPAAAPAPVHDVLPVMNDAGYIEKYDPDVHYVPSKPYAHGFNQSGRDNLMGFTGRAEQREAHYTPEAEAEMKMSDLELAKEAVHDISGEIHKVEHKLAEEVEELIHHHHKTA